MRVFVTGASGFIGSAIVRELLAAGYQVLGLARSDESAAALKTAGAEAYRGSLDDLDSLHKGASAVDGVIHTAFFTDIGPTMDFATACQMDRRAIETLGETLVGSDRPLVITSGTALTAPGRFATEDDAPDMSNPIGALRGPSEDVALSFVPRGVRVSIVRNSPSVHSEGEHGFVSALINIARTKGVSAYPDDGSNRWPAVHRLDSAHLYRLALENASAGSRLHAVADEGVPVRDIAGVIGRRLNIPVVSLPIEEVGEQFGFLGAVFSMDIPASSTLTQQRLGWHPVQPGLLADLDHDYYFN